MFNVCPNCGRYNVEKTIDPEGLFAICPHCQHPHPFLRLPLIAISGASGSGKTTICLQLVQELPECVVLESDILWRPEFNKPEDNYQEYRDLWLRLAKNISQNGRPVVLCGTVTPDGFERSPERRYFSQIHYLALVCEDETLVQRLKGRPAWRQASSPAWIAEMASFNNWLKTSAPITDPPMAVLDTTHQTIGDSTSFVAAWARKELKTHENSQSVP